MTDRELLQQALEDLDLIVTCAERAIGCTASEMDGYLAQISEYTTTRLAAIRARLAEPEDADARVQRVMDAANVLGGELCAHGAGLYNSGALQAARAELERVVRGAMSKPPAVTLPPLPPELWRSSRDEPADDPMFTADQMRDYAIAALRAAGVEVKT